RGRQFLGERLAPPHGRAENHIPLISRLNRLAHLLPAQFAEWVVLAAPEHGTAFRFAVADQVKESRRHGLDSPSVLLLTPASAKLAIWLWRAQAARNRGRATAAPLPSPRRMPKSSSGWASRAASTA